MEQKLVAVCPRCGYKEEFTEEANKNKKFFLLCHECGLNYNIICLNEEEYMLIFKRGEEDIAMEEIKSQKENKKWKS